MAKRLSVGQRKFLAEFSGNFAIAWLVGTIISPFFTENLLTASLIPRIIVGVMSAGGLFALGFIITKGVKS